MQLNHLMFDMNFEKKKVITLAPQKFACHILVRVTKE